MLEIARRSTSPVRAASAGRIGRPPFASIIFAAWRSMQFLAGGSAISATTFKAGFPLFRSAALRLGRPQSTASCVGATLSTCASAISNTAIRSCRAVRLREPEPSGTLVSHWQRTTQVVTERLLQFTPNDRSGSPFKVCICLHSDFMRRWSNSGGVQAGVARHVASWVSTSLDIVLVSGFYRPRGDAHSMLTGHACPAFAGRDSGSRTSALSPPSAAERPNSMPPS